jgi:hypothetical protein
MENKQVASKESDGPEFEVDKSFVKVKEMGSNSNNKKLILCL